MLLCPAYTHTHATKHKTTSTTRVSKQNHDNGPNVTSSFPVFGVSMVDDPVPFVVAKHHSSLDGDLTRIGSAHPYVEEYLLQATVVVVKFQQQQQQQLLQLVLPIDVLRQVQCCLSSYRGTTKINE
jgi:hypothetical protein